MQCILTKSAHGIALTLLIYIRRSKIHILHLDLFYAGETIPHRSIVSLSCPYCAELGFLPRTLLKHCSEQHSTISMDNLTKQLVVCKTLVEQVSCMTNGRNRFSDVSHLCFTSISRLSDSVRFISWSFDSWSWHSWFNISTSNDGQQTSRSIWTK